MEDDEDEQQQPSTPFWLKNTTFRSSSNRSLLRTPSFLFNSTSIILLLLLAAALIFIFFIIPSLLNFTSQIFRPNSVKRSWDSLNLVLILFAIICAFLGKTNNNETPKSASDRFRSPSPSPKYNREREQPYGKNSDRSYYNSSPMTRLRSSSSYPDLRQQEYTSLNSPWFYDDYNYRSNLMGNAYRFFDDTQIRSNQFSDSGWPENPHRIRTPPAAVKPQDRVSETEDDKFVENSKPVEASPVRLPSPPQYRPPPPPSQSLPPFNPLPEMSTRAKPRSRRTYRTIERDEPREETSNVNQKPNPNPLPPLSPSRAAVKRKTKRVHRSFDDAIETLDEDQQQKPPSPPLYTAESDLSKKSDQKRSGATKDFLSSFYSNQKRKKKRERQRSVENLDHILNPPVTSPSFTTTPPPPPPPPPPPSVFQNLFSSKKGKSKKSASDPPESATSKSRSTKPTTKIALAQPPIPTTTTKFTSYNVSNQQRKVTRGNESPLYGIPEPPPLPPFGMPVWKFVVEGDYVRLKSMNSSRSGSPELEDDRDDSIGASSRNGDSMRSETDEAEPALPETSSFCPSPDVNTKADNFIARFRAELKMEKVNSGKGVGLSRLGPNSSTNQ